MHGMYIQAAYSNPTFIKSATKELMDYYLESFEEYIENYSFSYNKFIKMLKNSNKFGKYFDLKKFPIIDSFIKTNLDTLAFAYNIDFIMSEIKRIDYEIRYEEFGNLLIKIENYIADITTFLFDYYTLVRFIKVRSYGGKNIIIVAGDSHIQTFLATMHNIGIDPIYKYLQSYSTSIDLFKSIIDTYPKVDLPTTLYFPYYNEKICNCLLDRLAEILLKYLTNHENEQSQIIKLITKINKFKKIYNNHKDTEYYYFKFIMENPNFRTIKLEPSMIENLLH